MADEDDVGDDDDDDCGDDLRGFLRGGWPSPEAEASISVA